MLFSKEWQWLRDDFSDGSQMPTRILYTMTISFKKEKKKRHFRKTKKRKKRERERRTGPLPQRVWKPLACKAIGYMPIFWYTWRPPELQITWVKLPEYSKPKKECSEIFVCRESEKLKFLKPKEWKEVLSCSSVQLWKFLRIMDNFVLHCM